MGADNQAQRVLDRLARMQQAQETAKLGATMQIYKTAKAAEKAARERERKQRALQMGDNDGQT